jgi:RND superfamily putative drug exporter
MSRLARLAIRHPLPLLGIWLVAFALSFAIGRASTDSLHTADLQISGTPADDAIRLSNREFGGTIAMAVLLRDTGGDTERVDREGPRIVRRLQRIPGVRVLNPWGVGGTRTLREPPGQALLALQVLKPFEQISNETTPAVRDTLDRYVKPPLRADLVGNAPTSREINDSILKSLRRGELLALLVLIPLLLLVFRSVVAALVPGISGVLTIVIGEALLGALNHVVPIDAIALNILTVLGLALGVDYSLLIVSRFREELAAGKTVEQAVELAAVKAGRTVLFAGLTLSAGMLVALLVLPGGVLVSGTLGVLVATITAMAVAIFALPAELALLGTNINRLPIGRGSVGGGFTRLATRALSKPGIAAALVALPLVLLCTPAIALDSRPPNFDQLPAGNRLRLGAEDFEANRPGGWIGPFEITFHSRGPVTTPKRLRALDRFQRKMIRTDGVAAVLGPSGLLRYSRQLENLTAQLSSGTAQSRRFERALVRVLRATGELRDGLEQGAQGSDQLVNGLEQAQSGTSTLNQSVQAAEPGTQQLAEGVEKTGSGAGQAAEGADRLSDRADELRAAVRDAQNALGPVPGQIDSAQTQQDNALRALNNASPAAQADPEVQAAIGELQALATSLQAIEGDQGSDTGVAGAGNDLSQAVPVAKKVANGSAELASGLTQLDHGIAKTASGASQVASGVSRLAGGTSALDSGIGLLLNGPSGNDGARALSEGLNQAADGTNRLGRGIQRLLDGVVVVREKAERQTRKLERRGTSLNRVSHSGYLMLAGIDSSTPATANNASFVVNTENGGNTVRVMVVPDANPFSDEAYALRKTIERDADRTAERMNATALVGGLPALGGDFDRSTTGRIPLLVATLALVTFLLLLLMFRSPLLAAFAVALNLLTVGAAIGILILGFQGDSPILGGPGYLDVLSLSAVFVIMFGLSIDYEVFLISRLLEGRRLTGTTDGAIEHGLAKTGTIITGAAAIMTGVFMAFALSPVATTRQLGVGLTAAVIIDATVVRLILFPALIRIFGERTWSVPPRLDRILPKITPP